MKSAPGIAFDYRPSRGIAFAIALVILLAMFSVLVSGLDTLWRAVLSILAIASGLYSLRQYLRTTIVRIARGDSGWILVDREGCETPVCLRDHIHRGFLLVLEFSSESMRHRRFVFTPDNLDTETRRRLLLVLASGEQVPKF
jgi:hypothetical protein